MKIHIFIACTVDSNDVLYGREPQFVTDVDSMCTVLLDNILEQLKNLSDKPNSQVNVKTYLILFNICKTM